jgi:hypothetical protein
MGHHFAADRAVATVSNWIVVRVVRTENAILAGSAWIGMVGRPIGQSVGAELLQRFA